VTLVYGVAGSADHNHLVTLTAAQLAQIKAKTPVTVVSTMGGDGHTHSVTVKLRLRTTPSVQYPVSD
jgi:hypothetical protein